MGRYIDVINAAEENGAMNEQAMAERVADMKADWEKKAGPLRRLLDNLRELKADLIARNVDVTVVDRTNYPVFNEWQPSVDFQLEKLNAFPPRQSPLYRVKCAGGQYHVTAEMTSGQDEGRTDDLGRHALRPEEVEYLILHAIKHYPWWIHKAW